MHRLVTLGLLFLGLAGVLATSAAGEGAKPDGPWLEVPAAEFDFGEVLMGDETSHKFTIRNTGSETLILTEVQATCGCTVPSGYDTEIPPGGETLMTLTYDNMHRPGAFYKSVSVKSNAVNDNGLHRLTVKGTVNSEVEYTPKSIIIDEIFRGEGATHDVSVWTNRLDELTLTELATHHEHIQAEVVPGDGPLQQKITVTVAEDAPIGPLHGRLTFKTNSTRQPEVSIGIMGRVFGDVMIAPQRINFFPGTMGQEPQAMTFTITDRAATGKLKVSDVIDEAGNLDFTIAPMEAGKGYEVKAQLKPEKVKPGYYAGMIEIHTNRRGEEKLTIDYNGFIRKAESDQAQQ